MVGARNSSRDEFSWRHRLFPLTQHALAHVNLLTVRFQARETDRIPSSMLHRVAPVWFGVLLVAAAQAMAAPPAAITATCGPAFSDSMNTDVGDTPCAMAIGDLDQDGHEDVVTGNCSSLDLSLLFGKGDGHFDDERRMYIGLRPGDVAIGDIDGDGNRDIAVNCTEQAQMFVYWGTGDRSFTSPTTIATPPGPTRLRIVDLDGDGHQDLVLLSGYVQGVEVIWGDGSRNPQNHSIFPIPDPSSPNELEIADLNRDGRPDLIMDTCSGASIYTLLNAGARSFRPAVTALTIPGRELCALALGDVNLDGLMDVAVVDAGSFDGRVAVAHGRGDGYFTFSNVDTAGPSPSGIAGADFDGDGSFDIAVSGGFAGISLDMRLFTKGATHPAGILPGGYLADEVISSDLNGDKVPDLVALNTGFQSVSVYLNRMKWDGVSVAYTPLSYQLGSEGDLLADLKLPGTYDPRLDGNELQLIWKRTVLGTASGIVSADSSTGRAVVLFPLHLLDAVPPGNQTLEIGGCDPQGIPFHAASSIEVIRMRGALQWSSPPGAVPILIRLGKELLGVNSLRIYDSRGRLVRTEQAPGTDLIAWDGKTDNGVKASAGVYVVTVVKGSTTHTCKVVVLR